MILHLKLSLVIIISWAIIVYLIYLTHWDNRW